MIMIKHLHNPELEKHYRAELASFAKLIKSASQYCTNREELKQLTQDPEKYILDQIRSKNPDIINLGLSFNKLCGLYDIDVPSVLILSAQILGHQYLPLLKADLTLDEKKVEIFIRDNAVTILTPPQAQVYEAAESLSSTLNALQSDLSKQGKRYDLSKLIAYKNGLMLWEPNLPFILHLAHLDRI